jgi:hypothetical protein
MMIFILERTKRIMKRIKCFSLIVVTILLLTACSSKGKEEIEDTLQETTIDNGQQKEGSNPEDNASNDIAQKTKDYILNGQTDKSEAEKIKWSKTFLDQVNIEDIYQEYLLTGGAEDDIQSFALYLSLNAPIPDNWEELVAIDLLNSYDVEISKLEYLEDDLYQVYVKIEGSEVPYVVVNSRTGYFHG